MSNCFVCGKQFKEGDNITIEFRNMKKGPMYHEGTVMIEVSKDALIETFHSECHDKAFPE